MEKTRVTRERANSSKSQLIKTARKLIAKHGYDVTTTRMIADAVGVSQSAISFHFGSKEMLCRYAVEYTAELIDASYDMVHIDIEKDFTNGTMTDELAWGYIQKLIRTQITYAFDPRNKYTMNLILRERTFPPEASGILPDALMRNVEMPLAHLLDFVAKRNDMFWATVVSRSINGSILTFAENPGLYERVISTARVRQGYLAEMEEFIFDFLMNGIRAAVQK